MDEATRRKLTELKNSLAKSYNPEHNDWGDTEASFDEGQYCAERFLRQQLCLLLDYPDDTVPDNEEDLDV